MDFQPFIRRPFEIEAVRINTQNIEEVAEKIGRVEVLNDGTPTIVIDRNIIPNMHRAFPGFWLTRIGTRYRCYSSKYFDDQFVGWDDLLASYMPVEKAAEETQA